MCHRCRALVEVDTPRRAALAGRGVQALHRARPDLALGQAGAAPADKGADLGSSEGNGADIDRIFEQLDDVLKNWQQPPDQFATVSDLHSGQANLILTHPEQYLAGAAEVYELSEHDAGP
jgi:hypothetical protein